VTLTLTLSLAQSLTLTRTRTLTSSGASCLGADARAVAKPGTWGGSLLPGLAPSTYKGWVGGEGWGEGEGEGESEGAGGGEGEGEGEGEGYGQGWRAWARPPCAAGRAVAAVRTPVASREPAGAARARVGRRGASYPCRGGRAPGQPPRRRLAAAPFRRAWRAARAYAAGRGASSPPARRHARAAR